MPSLELSHTLLRHRQADQRIRYKCLHDIHLPVLVRLSLELLPTALNVPSRGDIYG